MEKNAKKLKILRANYLQVLFVTAAFATMALVSYFYVSNTVSEQIYSIGDQTMDTMETAVNGNLNAAGLLFSDVVRQSEKMIVDGSNNAEIHDYLRSVQDNYIDEKSPLPEFMKIYGYIRGEFRDGSDWMPPATYDATQRPWYIGAQQSAGALFFSEPYVDADTGNICISFSKQINDIAGGSCGVLSIDLNLSQVTSHIRDQKIANNGYGVFVSDSLNFVTHREEDLIGKTMTDAGGDYARLAGMLRGGEKISAEQFKDSDGTASIAFFRTLFNGWYIGIITPAASYQKPIRDLAWLISSLGIALAAALSVLLVRTRVQKMRSDEESLSKSTFLARMSHEMRTPMNAIIGMTEIARRSSDPKKMEYCLGKIDDASKHLLGVINDVLDMSKIEAGKLELSPTEFALDEMISQAETVTAFKISEKKQIFEIDRGEGIPYSIIADKQRLAQVVTNLLSNATKFTPEGGKIILRIAKTAGSGEGGCMLRFEVVDTGIGISPEQQAHLFRSFEQADGSISRKYGGTGLGLAISKKIVETMGGEIGLLSEPGKGSTFSFTVPVGTGALLPVPVQDGCGQDGAARQDDMPVFTGKRILLAEDVEINREILIALLDGTEIEIDTAENGALAVGMFTAAPGKYDLIFMDVHMPEMDGMEAARIIRAYEKTAGGHIPIIAMTANVFKEDIEKCLAAGMDDHTGKPLELIDVIGKLKKYLRKR